MPTYTLEDKETGEQHEVFMTFSELQEYKLLNPNLKQVKNHMGGEWGSGRK